MSLLPLALLIASAASHAAPQSDPLKETAAQKAARMKWFEEARFGMFIHWGLYSVPAGYWKGRMIPGAGEWIMHEAKIKPEEYEPFRDQFNPVNFDAMKWVKIAKGAGMKYIAITSKHHEGFGMWPSAQGDWNIGHTRFHRDPLKELAAACKKEGLKLCFYHSIMDWHHPDYLPRRAWDTRPVDPTSFPRYVQYMKAQLKELLTNYGPIGIIWFDGQWESTWNHDEGIDLYRYIRSLQPNVIVNDRVDSGNLGPSKTPFTRSVGDYGTPEQTIPANGLPYPWETCMTMNDTWGFHAADHNWKSTETLVRNLIDIASKGGNYLLNVGPTSLGEIPDPSIERLAEVGKWTKANGEALYGTTASPFPRQLPWGRITQRPGKLYLHVFDAGAKGDIELTGLKNHVKGAYLLTNRRQAVSVVNGPNGPVIHLPTPLTDPLATVVVAQIDGPPVVDMPAWTASPDSSGQFVLDASHVTIHGETAQYEPAHKAIGYWTNHTDYLTWNVQVPRAGAYSVEVDLACAPGSEGGIFEVSVGGQAVTGKVPLTGSWDTFIKVNAGTINLPAGKSELKLRPVDFPGLALMNLRSIKLVPTR
ncbi:alpha-L-fucosidase [Fimbriimonas ginsengisoli]|uniref:alpha-L-fucosidase n=1 Tax=Fimbriimonas ginsengisoli Gsoil 348 TaxID=661478 RepID=A0A068NWM6_FIMGI|nr:alpha-L-fucosidase [Fimbriimonas ginsengisoli]AIE85994.1 putative glycosyl hydrolase [Fimbriimonas ginsengisoli Gsoil 348]